MNDNTSPASNGTVSSEPWTLDALALSASLTVSDLQKSIAWYRDIIGFTVDREFVREGRLLGARLVAGGVRILLNQDDGAKGLDRTKGEGISLMITLGSGVDALAARIKEQGGSLESEPTDTPWGARAFRLKDPDGFKFAISSEV